MTDVRELLPLYALGALDADEATRVERAVAADPVLAAELETYREAALDLVPPVAPPRELEARLMASVGAGRFERYSERFTELFDVTVDRARELFAMVERTASWELPLPGIGLIHFQGGPAYPTADCGFIRLAPRCTFPWHTHRGEESSLVLAGSLRDHEGRVFLPGDQWVQATGSAHEITAEGDEQCVFAARAIDGIEVGPRT